MLSIILLGSGALFAWGAWVFVLWKFDPQTGSLVGPALFYFSLALALAGTLTLARLLWHHRRAGMSASRLEVGIIVRQALLFALFAVVVLLLAAQRLLKWWNIIPLALLALTIELFFYSLTRRVKPYETKPTLH